MRPLIGSIRKWKKRAKGEHKDPSRYDCPLCHEHFSDTLWSCGDCPISKAGHDNCSGTPVQKYAGQNDRINGRVGGRFDMAARKTAQKMVDFMEGLR